MWRTSGCCGGGDIALVDVYGNGMPVGLSGLRQTFRQLHAAGLPPTEPTGEELMARIKAMNYVPRQAEVQYKAALLQEYAAFLAQNEKPRP
jgi:hypothetical protein